MFDTKVVGKTKTYSLCSGSFFWVENRAVCGKMWKNTVESDHRWQYGVRTLHAGQISYKHTLRTCNTHCFSTATLIARARLCVTLYVHCLSCNLYTLTAGWCEKRPVPPETSVCFLRPLSLRSFFFVKKQLSIWTPKYSERIRRIIILSLPKNNSTWKLWQTVIKIPHSNISGTLLPLYGGSLHADTSQHCRVC